MDNLTPAVGEGSDDGHSPTAEGRQCERVVNAERCPNRLPADAKPTRLYCDLHKAKGSKSKVTPEGSGERPPISIDVEVKAPRVSKADAALVEYATQLLSMVPMVLAMTGDEVCPPAIERSIPAIAAQLATLAKYHPGLKAFLTPGESTGEMVAWLGLLVATSPVLITVMVHHHMISDSMAERLTAFVAVGAASASG